MGFTLKYEILFEVQLLHSFYFHQEKGIFDFDKLSDLEKDTFYEDFGKFDVHKILNIEPDFHTEKLLRKHHLVFKTTPSGFFIGIKVEKVDGGKLKPFGGVDHKLKLIFKLEPATTFFSNITGLRFDELQNGLFYFSNRNGDTYPYMTFPIPKFKLGEKYLAGDLVYATNSNRLYEALEDTDEKLNSGKWLRLTKPQDGKRYYAGFSDHIKYFKPILNYRFPETNITEALFELIDFESNLKKDEFSFSGLTSPVNSFQLDLRNNKSGKYKLKVSGSNSYQDEQIGYLDSTLDCLNSFGLMAIEYEKGKNLGDYNILDPNNATLVEPYPVFRVALKNRSTYWLYTFNQEQNNADLGIFEKYDASNKRFVTKEIKPLSNFSKEIKKFDTEVLLPNPGVEIVKPLKPKVYSEIFL